MRKLKIFFKTFWRSLTEPAYYQDIIAAKFSFSLKYLAGLLFLVSFIFGVSFGLRVLKLIPQTPNFIQNAKKYIVETYPTELTLTLKDNKISSNVKEPFFIDLPTGAGLPLQADQGFKHSIAVNTRGKVEDFTKLESMFVLTADSVVVSDSGTGYKVMPLGEVLKKIPDGTSMTKANIESLLTGAQPFVTPILPRILICLGLAAAILYPFLRTGLVLVWELAVLVPVALILFIFAKALKRRLSYAKVYQMSMHGVTIPVIATFTFGGLFYPWLLLAAWLIFFIFLIKIILNQS